MTCVVTHYGQGCHAAMVNSSHVLQICQSCWNQSCSGFASLLAQNLWLASLLCTSSPGDVHWECTRPGASVDQIE
jgi:hypothetical protein